VQKDAAKLFDTKWQGTGVTEGRKQGKPWLGNGANSQRRMREVKKKNKEEKHKGKGGGKKGNTEEEEKKKENN